MAQRLKITEKVSFNIASEASYCHNLIGQKFIKNAKNSQLGEVYENHLKCLILSQIYENIEKS